MDQANLPDMDMDSWKERSSEEVGFWQNWILTKGHKWPQDFALRTDPKTPLYNSITNFIHELGIKPGADVSIMDIGSGPLTALGKVSEKFNISLTLADPLAEEYNRLLDEVGVTGVPRPQTGFFETSASQFGSEAFDVVWCCNSLDHSLDPLLGLYNLLDLCSIGGGLILRFHPNEADGGAYAGLHQWNLDLEDGQITLSQKERTVSLMPLLEQQEILGITQLEGQGAAKGAIIVRVKKTTSCNLSQCLLG
ncbi:hypothetical protein [Pseudophaeobacter sp.]|uniref:hypothetical protein n=1 Tax=Pseudophaeobacter sp. TaxID=1971739 RepID=UPI003298874D